MHMKNIKNEVKNNTTYLKRSKIKKLLFCNLEDLKEWSYNYHENSKITM